MRVLSFDLAFEEELERRATVPSRPLDPRHAALARRLAVRFALLGGPGDVLVHDGPEESLVPASERARLERAGIALPRIVTAANLLESGATAGGARPSLLPWGAGAGARALAERLGLALDAPPLEAVRRAASKAATHALAEELGLAPPGVLAPDLPALEAALRERFAPGEPWVVKRAFGFGGRGHLLGRGPELPPNGPGWARRALDAGEPVVLEPWLARTRDLSVQLDVSPGGAISVHGVLELVVTGNGAWVGNRFGALGLAAERELASAARRVGAALAARGYFGPVGIDAFEHAPRPGGAPVLRPLVEVNARHTLGRVSLALAPLLPPGGCGCYRLASVAAAARAGALVVDAVGPDERGPVAVLLAAASRDELLAREAALGG